MAYRNFTLSDLREKFSIDNRQLRILQNTVPLQPSSFLEQSLAEVEELPIRSEKAKSEWIVVPILKELRKHNNKFFTIYSGDHLNVDETTGLKGECDFILAKDTGTFDINYPIMQLVEAKKNDLEIGVPQCAAQMVGAHFYNQKKGATVNKIYGCVTTGNEWLFMVLEDGCIKIDTKIYYLNDVAGILGVFQFIIEYYRELLQ